MIYKRLTKMQIDVLKRLCLPDIEIANQLCKSLISIFKCVGRLKKRFNARNRTELAIKVCRLGVIDLYDFKTRKD